MKKIHFLVGLIVMLFLVTRLYKTAEIPPSLYWDEASIGYNAYSIINDGKDEWGKSFPLHFRAFGEFKLPVYIYATSISEVVFGVNDFAVRLPAILFSLGSVLLVYLFLARLIKDKKNAVLAAFFLTVSPWFFIFSRTGYEATAGVFFLLLGIYLFSLISKNTVFLLLSTLSFILSIYSHNSFILIAPLTLLFMAGLLVFSKEKLRRLAPFLLLSAIIFMTALIPTVRSILYDSSFNRIQAISFIPIIRWVTSPTGSAEFQIIPPSSNGGAGTFISNYLSHFSPDFLLLSGDRNPRSHVVGFGEIFFLDVPLFFLGIIFLLKNRLSSAKFHLFSIPFVILLAPLPASLTKESPHALRSLVEAPFLAILASLGLVYLIGFTRHAGKVVLGIILTAYLILFYLFFSSFTKNYSILASQDWQYGYKEIFTSYAGSFNKYDKVLVSDYFGQPYIYALYYLKYNPYLFRKMVIYNSPDRWGFSTVSSFDKFSFGINNLENLSGKVLIFATPSEEVNNLKRIGSIKALDDSLLFKVYEN